MFFFLMSAAAVAYIVLVLGPSFSSPRSRVYASVLGYPSLMRYLGKPIELTAVETVNTRPTVQVVSAEGSLGYLNEISIHCEVAGIITRVGVEPGQEIHPGDVLMRVDGGGQIRQLDELRLEEARAECRLAKAAYDRTKRLFTRQAASESDLELAELTLRQAEAALTTAEARFRYSLLSRSKAVVYGLPKVVDPTKSAEVDIVSTISGTVFRRTAQVGQNLTSHEQSMFLVGDQLTFMAVFDQRYASAVQMGDKGKFYLKAYPGTPLEGQVIRIANSVEPENQKSAVSISSWVQKQPPDTFCAWIAMAPESLKGRTFMTGMNGYCIFERPASGLAIPESALDALFRPLRHGARRGRDQPRTGQGSDLYGCLRRLGGHRVGAASRRANYRGGAAGSQDGRRGVGPRELSRRTGLGRPSSPPLTKGGRGGERRRPTDTPLCPPFVRGEKKRRRS